MAITEWEFERALDALAEEQIEQHEFERLCARHGLDPDRPRFPENANPNRA